MLMIIFYVYFQATLGTIAVMIGAGAVCQSIPYKEGFGAKQLAWMTHSGILGAVLAPMTMMGGPLLIRAAWMTAGVVGGRVRSILMFS